MNDIQLAICMPCVRHECHMFCKHFTSFPFSSSLDCIMVFQNFVYFNHAILHDKPTCTKQIIYISRNFGFSSSSESSSDLTSSCSLLGFLSFFALSFSARSFAFFSFSSAVSGAFQALSDRHIYSIEKLFRTMCMVSPNCISKI